MHFLLHIIESDDFIALFISIGLGYFIGKIKIGSFVLGGISGTLIAAILVSLGGGTIDPSLKNLFFALFLYAVGYESGPQFFASLSITALKDIILALFLAVVALLTIVVSSKIFHLDKGYAAGIAAGALTQSSAIGSASDGLNLLHLSPSIVANLETNMAVGFAITYLFGVLSAIFFCTIGLEKLYKRSIRLDANEKENELKLKEDLKIAKESKGHLFQPFMLLVLKELNIEKLKLSQIEQSSQYLINILKIKRNGKVIDADQDAILTETDELLVFCRADMSLNLTPNLAKVLEHPTEEWNIELVTKKIVLTNKEYIGRDITDSIKIRQQGLLRGTCLLGITRKGKAINLENSNTSYQLGDIFEIYGLSQEISKLANEMGKFAIPSKKTDFVFVGLGLTLGALLGGLSFKFFGIKLKIGVTGMLLSGLIFGWINHRKEHLAYIPSPTVIFLQDFGLTAFIAGVGLSAGKQAIHSIIHFGIDIFFVGLLVSFIPLVATYLFGRYVLKYDNVAVIAGALSGARSADPAFGLILERAGNSIPTHSFTITFAIANLVLTLLGPLIVAIT